MEAKETLSVCMIVRDEEKNITRALASVSSIATEIVVADTGSVDGTVRTAESLGARVVSIPWNDDFAEARNAALAHTTGDWVLILDADEAVSPELARDIDRLLKDSKVDAYLLPVMNVVDGRRVDRVPIVRLFRNKPAYRFTGRVHERIADSIQAAGGVIKTIESGIEHYGYTTAENERKGRRQRNIRLLKKALQDQPESATNWHFLGMEYLIENELGMASSCFCKCMQLAPEHGVSALSAHRLLDIGLRRKRLENGWQIAQMGRKDPITQRDSLVCMIRTALFEGDAVTARTLLRTLRKQPVTAFGYLTPTPAWFIHHEATALWVSGRKKEAIATWGEGADRYPEDFTLAREWIRHKALYEGIVSVVSDARTRVQMPSVLNAAVGALLRARQLDLAAALARVNRGRGHASAYSLYGLAHAGEWSAAQDLAKNGGIYAALCLATAAVWFGRLDLLPSATEELPESWRSALNAILESRIVPTGLVWAADMLMVHWADVGCLELLRAGAEGIRDHGGLGRAAWLLLQSGMADAALQWALEAPDQPESLEVLGLIAFDHGDYAAAAHFLRTRVELGPAKVEIYAKAAVALRRTRESDEATAILKQGRNIHPWSRLLAN